MKPLKLVLFLGLTSLIFSACTAMYVQTSCEEEPATQVIIIEQPVPVPCPYPESPAPSQPVINQPELKKKVRTNNGENVQTTERESNNSNNVRNNSGQRNVKSRGN